MRGASPQRATSVHVSLKAVVDAAREIARSQPTELIVHSGTARYAKAIPAAMISIANELSRPDSSTYFVG